MNENWTVKQVSRLTGLTVRTLHHYDQIGLLKPAFVAENGYRYYNQENLARLQEILLFRELDFPLKDIQQLLDVTEVNRQQVLRDHISLLELKRNGWIASSITSDCLQKKEEKSWIFTHLTAVN
ncbi:MerR family transcriptional regulator [Streptococcus suis]|nr:MerR family transcriptional regulator [Streptococcus suis]